MEARVRLGEFDPPGYEGNPYNKITTNMYNTEENHALALKAAEETIVLLKNANHTLPLKTNIGTVAVIGPNANAFNMQLGNYNGHPTPQHQHQHSGRHHPAVGADHVLTATAGQSQLSEATNLATKADAVVLVVGIDGTRKANSATAMASNFPECRRA